MPYNRHVIRLFRNNSIRNPIAMFMTDSHYVTYFEGIIM